MSANRNVLFALLAFQNDFLDKPDFRRALEAWVADKSKPMGQHLIDLDLIEPNLIALLEQLVDRHVARHGSAAGSLGALSASNTAREVLDAIPDDDVRAGASLITRYSTVGTVQLSGIESMVEAPFEAKSEGGRFRVLRSHARGGLGEVFVAEDLELHRQIALKEIQDRHADDEDSRSRFVLEAEITGNLEHPGIVPVYGLGAYPDGRPFYAMRFIKGDSLKEAIDRFHRSGKRPQSPKAAAAPDFSSLEFRGLLRRFIDVCNAIAYAHSRGVLHRDLKPGNVMLGKFGETLVVDWGLAKIVAADASSAAAASGPNADDALLRPTSGSRIDDTMPGRPIGTPAFMSPEQATGDLQALGVATDVYGLGATLYSLLTGQAPFQGKSIQEILLAVTRGDCKPPIAQESRVPPALNAICVKAMAVDPKNRFVGALELAADVERWLADEPPLCFPEPWADRARRWIRKHRTLVGSAAAGLLVAVIAAIGSALVLDAKNRDLRKANDVAEAARKSAVANLDAAVSAVNTYLDKVAEDAALKQNHLLALRRRLLADAVPFYERFVAQNADRADLDLAKGKSLARLASIQSLLGKKQDALRLLEQSQAALGRAAGGAPSGEIEDVNLSTVEETALVLRELGRLDESIAMYRKALTSRAAKAQLSPDNAPAQRMLARAEANLAMALHDRRLLAEAETLIRQAIDRHRKLLAAGPKESAAQKDLCYSLATLAGVLNSAGKHGPADTAVAEAAGLRRQIAAANPDDLENRRELANLLAQRTRLALAIGNGKQAEEWARAEVAARDELAKLAPLYPSIRYEFLYSRLTLGELQRAFNKPAAALETQQQLLVDLAEFQRRHPDVPEYLIAVASCHHALGTILTAPNTLADAEGHFADERAILESLRKANPQDPGLRERLASCLNNLANVYEAMTRPADALELRRASLTTNQTLVAEFPDVVRYSEMLGAAYCNLGISEASTGKLAAAIAMYDRAIQTLTPLATREPASAQARKFLCNSHSQRGQAREKLKQHATAADDHETARRFCDRKDQHYKYATDESWCRARAGQVERAAAIAEALVRADLFDGETHYDAALAYALCAKANGEPKQQTAFADKAMSLLQSAMRLGYRKQAEWAKDPDFSALHARADFKRLVETK